MWGVYIYIYACLNLQVLDSQCPLHIRVPSFLVFSLNQGTLQSKGQSGAAGEPSSTYVVGTP